MTSTKMLVLVTALSAALLAPGLARAEPYFAVREGFHCSQCHVNRTGGGKRTDFGYQYALTHLALLASRAPADAASGGEAWRGVDPHLNDAISAGANMRASYSGAFGDKVHHGFESQEANVYLQLAVTRNLLAYVDTSFAQGAIESREAFLMLSGGDFSLKAGTLLLPYGLRIWGDQEFIRSETHYNFASPDLGAELGYERGPLAVYLAVSNGTTGSDPDNMKKVSAQSALVFRTFRVGLSGSYNDGVRKTERIAGPFVGVSLGRLTLLGEADLLSTRYKDHAATVSTLLAYAEADLLVARGLNLKLSYGYHDPDLDQGNDQRLAMGAAVEAFPFPLLGVALRYRHGSSVPQDATGNQKTLVAELHVYF
jgi:hypothetical protein